MRRVLFLSGVLGIFFVGCADKVLTITKCKSYKDGICVAKEVKQVEECKNPTKIDNRIYCEKD